MSTAQTTTTAPAKSQFTLQADETSNNDVKTILDYIKPGITPKPFILTYEPEPGVVKSNVEHETHEATIRDIRGHESEYSIDKNGFQFVKDPVSDENRENLKARNDEAIVEKYYPEIERLLKEKLGVDRVFIFDHTVRAPAPKETTDSSQARGPVGYCHVDQTPKAGYNRVHRHLPDEAEELLKGRVQIINVWRPLIEPIEDHPLAVADYFSLADGDLQATDLIYPDRVGETYGLHYNPNHKWHYLSKQKTDEVIFIKCFDTKDDPNVAKLTPHTAFSNPNTRADAPSRQSVEVRTLVFYNPENSRA